MTTKGSSPNRHQRASCGRARGGLHGSAVRIVLLLAVGTACQVNVPVIVHGARRSGAGVLEWSRKIEQILGPLGRGACYSGGSRNGDSCRGFDSSVDEGGLTA